MGKAPRLSRSLSRNISRIAESTKEMRTKRDGIREASLRGEKLRCLMIHFTEENLTRCYHQLDARKAVGIDQVTKEMYGVDLKKNISDLVSRLRSMSYRPQPARLVKIPKSDGKERPLAISCLEDKIVQMLTKELLDAVYEPIFLDCSYGFRSGRSCHDAIRDLDGILHRGKVWHVLDIDLQNFFGEISHSKLLSVLKLKISDKRFLRYISRMLKSGIMSESHIVRPESGSPQGSICSPVLANVYAHYCIDVWFEKEVKPRLAGRGHIVRYADDMCICLSHESDVQRVMSSLKGRLSRFDLLLNEAKTSMIKLDKGKGASKSKTFSFLGFEFYVGKSRKGWPVIKIKTAGKTLRRSLKELTDWIKLNRNKARLRNLWDIYLAKVRGHLQYFGVSGNFRWLSKFITAATRIFFKWINRRSQKRSFSWDKFKLFLEKYPLPAPRIVHKLY